MYPTIGRRMSTETANTTAQASDDQMPNRK